MLLLLALVRYAMTDGFFTAITQSFGMYQKIYFFIRMSFNLLSLRQGKLMPGMQNSW